MSGQNIPDFDPQSWMSRAPLLSRYRNAQHPLFYRPDQRTGHDRYDNLDDRANRGLRLQGAIARYVN